MHPVLFESGPIAIYTYGFLIAVGAVLGFTYMAQRGKKLYGMTFDQANTLFILLVVAGVVGGKLFMIFEDPGDYLSHPGRLFSGSGFVFYGSLLLCIPTMLLYFQHLKLPIPGMLDIMAIVACIAHGFGRLGCFMAGCCYGLPTDGWFVAVFTDPECQARPLNTPLHPTQLYESLFIFTLMGALILIKRKKQFDSQVFLIYLIGYAIGRGVIEMFRGDIARGFIIRDFLTNSQFISLLIILVAVYYYVKLSRKAKLIKH